MSRSSKCRIVCSEYENTVLTAEANQQDYITLAMEEMEAIRLCDYEGYDQETAATSMMISRGTLQRMLYTARRKVAQALCEGKGISIRGGNYEIRKETEQCKNHCKKCIKNKKK